MEQTVYFRTFEEEDAPLIYQWMNDDELKKLSVGLNRRMSRDEALNWVKRRMEYDQYNYWWAICAKDTDKMIGYMSLNSIHYINRSAEFGGIVIGDSSYNDGFAWMESYLFIMEYTFERLGMNRLYGSSVIGHKQSNMAGELFLFTKEGVSRKAVYKNGKFYDLKLTSILKDEYFDNKKNGEYELKNILRRLRQLKKQGNN